MRIALFHNAPSGGAKRAIYEWTRRLVTRHKVDVYTLSSADHASCDIRPLVQKHRVFNFAPHKLFESPWGRLNQLQRWRDLGKLTDIGRRIASEINAGEYDVVFANTCLYTFIPAFLQFVHIPAVYYLHEPFGRMFRRQFHRPYLKNNKWRAIIDRFDPLIGLYNRRMETIHLRSVRQTKQLLANSQFTQKHIKKAFNVDAPACHLGVNCEEFRPIPGIRKENYVISVGELAPRKGFDFLVESLSLIPADSRPELRLACNNVRLVEKDYVQDLAAQCEVELRVLTDLNADELAIQYNRAKLCVYAPVLEPFGLVPLEAMACGTPVVGVREGGVQESIVHEHTGLLVERNPVQFAEAIRSLLEDTERREKYGQQAREYVLEKWTWDRAVATLERHLTSCVMRC